MGINSLVGGYTNERSGGTFSAGWWGGQVNGLISGFGGPIAGFLGGFGSNMTTGLVDNLYYGRDISYSTIFVTSLIAGGAGAIFNMTMPHKVAFGVSMDDIWYNAAAMGYALYISGISAFRGYLSNLALGKFPSISDPKLSRWFKKF